MHFSAFHNKKRSISTIFSEIVNMMNEVAFVIDRLKSGDIFFFAGSGISYASDLPASSIILQHTANALLPNNLTEKEKSNICKTIQPEVFYELVIGLTRTYESLEIWRSLYKGEQNKHQINCKPALSHLFIAEYSNHNQLPIITTNFDSMFEQACDILGIKYKILLPSDDPSIIDNNSLYICKIHGSIQDGQGEYSPQSLWTTMTQITKVNTKWIEHICRLMNHKHLCFVGYSGRDIDLFPYLSEASSKKSARQIIWINRFDGDHSDTASKSCYALRVYKWPSELFESARDMTDISKYPNTSPDITQENKINKLLQQLETDLANKCLLSSTEKDLLYCMLLAKLGNYRKAHKNAVHIEKIKQSSLTNPLSKNLLILTCARLSHEISRYETCKKYALQALKTPVKRSEYDINIELQARFLVSEALRMGIPGDMYFTRRNRVTDYLYVIYVVGYFIYTSITNNIKMRFEKISYSELRSEAQHEFIEHRIRFYALIQSVSGSPGRGWNSHIKKFLIRKWEDIKKTSHHVGYSAGIANSGKFKYRLIPSEIIKCESANIYNLTTSATGSELLIRNEADQLLLDGKFDHSRKEYLKYSCMARKSGNTLNEIKGILGYAYANHTEGKSPLLSESLKSRYCELVDLVEGRRWKEHFQYIERKLFNTTITKQSQGL